MVVLRGEKRSIVIKLAVEGEEFAECVLRDEQGRFVSIQP